MAGISDKDKTVMTAKAGGPASFESLGESLQAQLEKAQGAQAGFESFQPTAQANAEAIGSFEDRAPGEAPVDIRAQGLSTAQSISATANKTQGNILDVISSMMNLKSKQDALEQQAFDNKRALNEEELAANELGMTIDETTGQPRRMTDEEVTEAGLSEDLLADKVDSLKEGAKTKISDHVVFVKRLQEMKLLLEGEGAATTFGGSITSGITGPLAKLFGELSSDEGQKNLRTKLDLLEQDMRKEIFGGAFTETERKVAQLPGSVRQESTNVRIINDLYARKTDALVSRLKIEGFSNAEIKKLMKQNDIDPELIKLDEETTGADNTGGIKDNEVEMTDPSGNTFYLDKSEASEAEENGWERV